MAASATSLADLTQTRRITKKFHLVWLVNNIDKLKKDFSQSISDLENITGAMDTFDDAETFTNYLFENTQKKIILIASGAMGENIVPILHDAPHLDSVFIFCFDIARHEQWAKDLTKVKGVFKEVHAMCEAVKQAIETSEFARPRRTRPLPEPLPDVSRPVTPQRRSRDTEETNRSLYDSSKDRDKKDPPLVNSMAATSLTRSSSEQPLSANLEELQRTIIAKTERGLRQSLLGHAGGAASSGIDAIDRLQATVRQTMDKHVTSRAANSDDLNKLFADLKQSLVETLIQQQPMLLQDLIKQSVADALKEQHTPLPTVTTARSAGQRKPITIDTAPVIKITADGKRTRIDAAFRRQRDAVVSSQRFRDLVQQWIAVTSMADLTVKIKAHGSNDLECAWMLYCWIGENINYVGHCNVNKAETVFRTRQGVCRGFASLYHECCTLLSIECSEISGYAKNNLVKSSEELKQSPHAWNTIVLDGFTYLVDPTWGAGGRDNDKTLEDFYFLTAPEEFIYSHYSTGSQLLAPEITKNEFLSLPVMRSVYYQLGLHLLSPKQSFNQIHGNLFQICIRTPDNVDLCVGLKVGHEQYPRSLHTLCQRDRTNRDVYNCCIAPPVDGLYEIDIYAKTNDEASYRGAINMRLQVSDIAGGFTFPITYSTFTEHQCILVEPLQRLVRSNEEVLIHMTLPGANVVKIRNGDDYTAPSNDEYKNGVLKKKVRVQGDLQVCARWDDEADTISVICAFHMI